MEDNKENYARLRTESRIPLPVDTLPPVPRHLTLDYIKRVEEGQRAPLKPINSQDGASTGTSYIRKTSTPKLDTRHVTKRKQSDDELDWNYDVFKDTNVVVISSDEEEVLTGVTETVHEQSLEDRTSTSKDASKGIVKNVVRIKSITTTDKLVENDAKAVQDSKPVTPSVALEPNRVRKIKQSLKRPHSRELQGLSPPCKVRRFVCPPTRTIIRGSIGDRLQSLDQVNRKYSLKLTQAYTTDLLSYLQSVEERPCTKNVGITNNTRALVLNWLMKVNGPHGDPAILQTASWYLDKILQHGVSIEKLQLVATACYWVAKKLYQPGMAESASRLVKCVSNSFTPAKLIWAEMVLMKSLNFPRQPVIPNDFVAYFASCCDPDQPGEVEVAATFLFMSGALVSPGTSLDYPSSVAAAAVRNAVLLIRKPDALDKLLSCPEYKSAEAKAENFSAMMSSQRVAARAVADAKYAFKTPFHQYGTPPTYIAQKVVKAAGALAMADSINLLK